MSAATPRGPLQLRIPGVCAFCAAAGRVFLEPTLTTAESILLHWRCANCHQSWPVTPRELTILDRRNRTADRRKQPRSDRRKQ
jgi:hypothetical protein